MGKPLAMALRERVAAFVDEGHGHREAARHFRVSSRFVNELMKLRRETGSLAPRRMGHAPGSWGKLASHAVPARADGRGERTDAGRICVELEARSRRAQFQCRLSAASSRAQPQKRCGPPSRSTLLSVRRGSCGSNGEGFFARALPRLIFIDETSTNTGLIKRTGWSPKGERYKTHAPFGKWHRRPLSPACTATAWSRRGSSMRR